MQELKFNDATHVFKILKDQLISLRAAIIWYVALSRHREQADVYWGREQFSTVEAVKSSLSRERLKDVSLDYADVRGFERIPDASNLPAWAKPYEADINKLAKQFGKTVSFKVQEGDKGVYRSSVKVGQYYFGIMEQDKCTKLIPYDKCRFIDKGERFTLQAVKNYRGKSILEAKVIGQGRDRGGIDLER